MAYETKPNSGALFRNAKKSTDRHPDYNGNAVIECVHCRKAWPTWVSGWLKTSAKGTQYMSLSFNPMDEDGQQQAPPQRQGGYANRDRGNPRGYGGGGQQQPHAHNDVPF